MSQFGTIGTPRMHPCMGHPSCSQFNANDIIRTSAARDMKIKNNNFSLQLEATHNMEEENNITIPTSVTKTTVFDEGPTGSNRHNKGISEEENRRYIEVSPGVWSY